MKYTNFDKISFLCMFVMSYNFEMTTRACVSEAHWRNKVNCFELLLEILGHVFRDKIQKEGKLSLWMASTLKMSDDGC